MKLQIKICGLTRREDVAAACSLGVDWLGCVMVPGSPRFVDEDFFASIFSQRTAPCVLVVADMPLDELNALLRRLKPEAVQLHGKEDAEYARSVRGAQVWKACCLQTHEDVEAAAKHPASVVVADSRNGGSGVLSDWRLASELARAKKVFLAGGISPENVAAAAATPGIIGLDVSSGVEESPGRKSLSKIKKIMEICKR